MSRLRRLVLSDRFFFIACRTARDHKPLGEAEFEYLARALRELPERHGYLLTAWVFLPDHCHAIIFPRHPLTISRVMGAIKVASTLRGNGGRHEPGILWQPRFFDRALRTAKETSRRVSEACLRRAGTRRCATCSYETELLLTSGSQPRFDFARAECYKMPILRDQNTRIQLLASEEGPIPGGREPRLGPTSTDVVSASA